jgi:hypothetical protein
MADPVSTADGHSYEREAITEWFAQGNRTSPLTGAPLDSDSLMPNHALRLAIQQHVDDHPEVAKDLYRTRDADKIRSQILTGKWAQPTESAVASSASESSAMTPSGKTPIGAPVQKGTDAASAVPFGLPVQPPLPDVKEGLSASDCAAAAPLVVADWSDPTGAASSTGFRSRQGWFSLGRSTPRKPPAHPDEPRMKCCPAEGGGVQLDAEVLSESSLLRLAMRLGANGSAPLAALRIRAPDGFGPGTAAPLDTSGEPFLFLCRALASAAQSSEAPGALAGLRELSFTKITIGNEAAAALASGLRGHPSLESLELWNVGLEDDGALCIGRLAAPIPEGNAALRSLNLGRNVLSGETRDKLEAMVDGERVHAKVY